MERGYNGKMIRKKILRAREHSRKDLLEREKVLYLLKCKVCGEAPYVGKAKTTFRYRFNNYKSKHRAFTKGNRKYPRNVFMIIIVWMVI